MLCKREWVGSQRCCEESVVGFTNVLWGRGVVSKLTVKSCPGWSECVMCVVDRRVRKCVLQERVVECTSVLWGLGVVSKHHK